MIDKCLETLKKALKDYLILLPELNITSGDVVSICPVVKNDGSIAVPENNIGITLVNVEEERVGKAQQPVSVSGDGRISLGNPELRLNLYLLISANFPNYDTGIQFLSAAVRCFQSNNVFTNENTPDMDSSLKKLIVELFTLNFEQQNHLWGSLGAKYLPSVIYKVRLVTIQEGQKKVEYPPITGFNVK